MLVHAVTGVENGKAGFGFEQPGRAGGVVTQDDGFSAERAQGEARVFEGLAFFNAGGKAGDERGVAASSKLVRVRVEDS